MLRTCLTFWTALCLLPTHLVALADTQETYEIVSKSFEGDSVVATVRTNGLLALLYDQTIIGLEFGDPSVRDQAAFPAFGIMQAVSFLDRPKERAMQIGLGVGTVPSFLRKRGIPTDAVEISEAVVAHAAENFQYERCEEEDYRDCPLGKTYVTEGVTFIKDPPSEPIYDIFTIDVYTGSNPLAFFVKEIMNIIRTKWLKQNGVLVLNFVGYYSGPHSVVPRSIYKTLQTEFPHVHAHREMEECDPELAANIIFFASDKPIVFQIPTTGLFKNPRPKTVFNAMNKFQDWEIFHEVQVEIQQNVGDENVAFGQEDPSGVRILTEADNGHVDFAATHALTQEHMQTRVVDQFPQAMWDELRAKA